MEKVVDELYPAEPHPLDGIVDTCDRKCICHFPSPEEVFGGDVEPRLKCSTKAHYVPLGTIAVVIMFFVVVVRGG